MTERSQGTTPSGDAANPGGAFGNVSEEPDLPRHEGLGEVGDEPASPGQTPTPGGNSDPTQATMPGSGDAQAGSDPMPDIAGTGSS